MKKNLLWMFAAILTCGLIGSFMTSCSEDDNPVIPEIKEKLTGEWLVTVNQDDDNDVEYVLFKFEENGVVIQNIYIGDPAEPIRYWERMNRHGIYTLDETAQTILCELISDNPETIQYSLSNGLLTLKIDSEIQSMTLTLHRPTQTEKALLSIYDLSLEGNDYEGKWFSVEEANGQYTYVMLDFTEDSGLKTTRYSVKGDQCIRTEYTQYYNEYDNDEDEQVLEIHNITDYMLTELYWWEVSGNTLTLETEKDDEEVVATYHALTPADIELMAELDKKCNRLDNIAGRIKGKWMMSEVNGQPVLTNSKQVLTYESATKFYYSLSISAISDLNVWVNRCEGRFNVNGTTLAQLVKLPDSNIKFSQQFNLISITDNEIQLIANNETFIDGESHRNTTGLMERKVRVTHDYSDDIIGTWEGRLTSEQDAYSDNQLHRWEYKTDGTFVYYRQNEKGEWVADVNTMAEYFVDGTLLCSRWKNVGDDTEKRESWEIASIENDKMNWTALRQNEDGSTYTANFSMTRVNP